MTALSQGDRILLLVTGLVVAAQAAGFKQFFWDTPLKYGKGFFLGVAVPPGFYDGEGVGWLRGYRALIIAVNLALLLALVAVLVSGRWLLLPLWAGGVAVLHVAALFGFRAYASAKLGANPPVESRIAISLESRRLRDYLSLPGEAVAAAIVVASWLLLFLYGDSRVDWFTPAVTTYIVLGFLFLAIASVRIGLPPLPTDRPEEHRRWIEESRRYGLRCSSAFRWVFVTVLAAYALLHSWPLVAATRWAFWLLVGLVLAFWLGQVLIIFIGGRRLTAMGRGLRPAGSWSTPYRQAGLMPRGWMVLFFAWFGGLVALIVLSMR